MLQHLAHALVQLGHWRLQGTGHLAHGGFQLLQVVQRVLAG